MSNKELNISEDRLLEFIEMLSDMAAFKFSKRLTTSSLESPEDILAEGLNMLCDEWKDSITSSKKLEDSERRYRNLFENMNDGLVFVDNTGKIEFMNPSFCRIMGYSPIELKGDHLYNLAVDFDRKKDLLDIFKEKYTDHIYKLEIKLRHKKGQSIWVDLSAHPYVNIQGDLTGVMCILSDKTERKQAEEQREGAYHLLKQSETRLRAENREVLRYQSMLLSSQLSPHFIFNALNSIQYHILGREIEPTLEFVANFASLMRSVMLYSDKEFISLEQELEFLEDYLNLEKSRHSNKFDFEIHIGENVDINNNLIPPMLLQPFIENSIIHGINHLSSGGFIRINVQKKDSKTMICEIIDNGVGVVEARKRNQFKVGEKNLNSSIINRSRIDILNNLENKERFKVEVEDLGSQDSEFSGIKVTLFFPLIED